MDVSGLQNTYSHYSSSPPRASGLVPVSFLVFPPYRILLLNGMQHSVPRSSLLDTMDSAHRVSLSVRSVLNMLIVLFLVYALRVSLPAGVGRR